MTSSVVQVQWRDTKLRISPPKMKQCYWNLAAMLGPGLFSLPNEILPFVAAWGKMYEKCSRGGLMEGGTGIRLR